MFKIKVRKIITSDFLSFSASVFSVPPVAASATLRVRKLFVFSKKIQQMELILKRKPLTICKWILNYKINENIIHYNIRYTRIEKKKGPKEKAITKGCWSEKCKRVGFKLDSVIELSNFERKIKVLH